MNNNKRNNDSNTDHYEDVIRLENLDPYEGLIKPFMLMKQDKKTVE